MSNSIKEDMSFTLKKNEQKPINVKAHIFARVCKKRLLKSCFGHVCKNYKPW